MLVERQFGSCVLRSDSGVLTRILIFVLGVSLLTSTRVNAILHSFNLHLCAYLFKLLGVHGP